MITILNSSILTSYGTYTYRAVTLEEARALVAGGFASAIGHASTASVISVLLGIECQANRITYFQEIGDKALILKLNGRAPEGRILSVREIKEIGYAWGVLERTA